MMFSEMQGRPPVAARKMGNHRGLPLRFGCGSAALCALRSQRSGREKKTFVSRRGRREDL